MSTETSRRTEANRRNARQSTGPRTAAGKARSRFNALKHGLSARLDVMPGEDGDAFKSRLDAWIANLQPRDEVERYLVERAVHISWQLDRADRAQAARMADARFAGTVKAGDAVDQVASLGRRLFWDPRGPGGLYPDPEGEAGDPRQLPWSNERDDPNDPVRLVNRLEGSALGCAWLLDRWGELRAILEEGRKWQPSDRFRAIRLLGKQPIDAIDDLSVMMIYLACGAMDPTGPHAFADVTSGLPAQAARRFLERLEGRGAMSRMPADPEAGRSDLLETILEAEERIEELLAVQLEREESSDGRQDFDDTESGDGLRRYQLTFNRTLLRILETLRKRRQEPADGGGHAPAASRRSASVGRGPAVSPREGGGGSIPRPDLLAGGVSIRRPEPGAAMEAARSVPRSVERVPERPAPPTPNSKNEPNADPRPLGVAEGAAGAASRNSKNEPNDPTRPSGRRPLAALFGLFGLALSALPFLFHPVNGPPVEVPSAALGVQIVRTDPSPGSTVDGRMLRPPARSADGWLQRSQRPRATGFGESRRRA